MEKEGLSMPVETKLEYEDGREGWERGGRGGRGGGVKLEAHCFSC